MFSNLSIPFTNAFRHQEQPALSRNKLGELTVTLHRASGLAAADSNGFSDPYVKLRVKYREGSRQESSAPQDLLEERTSSVKHRTLDPEWNETFTLPVYDSSAYLHVEVYDKNSVMAGVFLGQFEVGMNRCFRSGNDVQPLADDEAYALTSGDAKGNGHVGVSGNVRISLYYIPEGPKMTLSMMEAREMDTIDELSLSVSGVYSSERKSTLFRMSDNGLCQWEDTLLFSCPTTVPRQSKVKLEVKEKSVILGVVNMSCLGHAEVELADVIQVKNRSSGVSYHQSRWLEVIGDRNEVVGEVFVNVSIPADVELEQVEWKDSHPEAAANVSDDKMEMITEMTGEEAGTNDTIEMINKMTGEEAGLYIEQLPTSEVAQLLNKLDADRVVEVFENMPRFKEEAQVMKQMRTGVVSRILGRRSSLNATAIMTHMSSQMASDVIAELEMDKAAEVLAIFPASTAIEIIGYMDVEKSAAFLACTEDERVVEMVAGLQSQQAAEICDNLHHDKASKVLSRMGIRKRATITALMQEIPVLVGEEKEEDTFDGGDVAADGDSGDVVPELRSPSIRRPMPLVPIVALGSGVDWDASPLEGLRSPLESARSGLESARSISSMPERPSFYDTEEESVVELAYDQSGDERSEEDLSEEEDARAAPGMERHGMQDLDMMPEDEDEEDDVDGSLLSRFKGPQGSGRPGSMIRFQVEDTGPPPPRATYNASNTRTQLNKLKQKSKILIGKTTNRPPVWERLAMSKDSRNAKQAEPEAGSRARTPPVVKAGKHDPGRWSAETGSSSDRGSRETSSAQAGKKERSKFRFTQGWVGTVWERLNKPKCPLSPEEVAGKQKPHPKGFGSSAQTERLSPVHGRKGDISPSTSSHTRTSHSRSPVRSSPSKSPARSAVSPGRPVGFGTSQNLGRLVPPKAEHLPAAGETVLPGKDRRYSVKAVFGASQMQSPKSRPRPTSPSPPTLECGDERRLQSEKEEAKLCKLCESNPTKGADELGRASVTVASRVMEAITPQQVIVLLRHIQPPSAAAAVKNLYAFIKWLEQMPPRTCLGQLQSLPIQVRGSVLSRMHSNNVAQILQLLRDEDVGEMLGALEPRCVAVLMQVQSINTSVYLMQKLEASQIALVVREINPMLAIAILKAMESKFELSSYLQFVLRDVEAKRSGHIVSIFVSFVTEVLCVPLFIFPE
ncbi:hypothetical protein CYMTET_37123 [Cymbomonas tetramitiformis]|uniref:C2 domain-containing protein n=1 Tax=Cymbomonas tetramitiformis TaxID=36881 RepID=A0AAE0CGB8_9CHLO|nr:hypothetical protein CYMTET_37123 [Cymbomonas tetramitiformis]